MSEIIQIGSKEALEKVIKGDKPVLVDFFAPWCGPCQMMGAMLDDFVTEYKNIDKVQIVKVDIDQFKELAEQFNVMSVPTFVFFDKGKSVDVMTGPRPMDEIESKLDKLISSK